MVDSILIVLLLAFLTFAPRAVAFECTKQRVRKKKKHRNKQAAALASQLEEREGASQDVKSKKEAMRKKKGIEGALPKKKKTGKCGGQRERERKKRKIKRHLYNGEAVDVCQTGLGRTFTT